MVTEIDFSVDVPGMGEDERDKVSATVGSFSPTF